MTAHNHVHEHNHSRQDQRVNILNVEVDAQTLNSAVSTLAAWATDPSSKRYVCTCPVYTLMLCGENPILREAINHADMVTADGMPIVWVQRRWGYPVAERVYGPDIMLKVCEQTAQRDIRHFFLGGMPGVAERLANRLKADFPELKIAGTLAPLIADAGEQPDIHLVETLNQAQPNIIWIGLGSPKQDLWMRLYRPHLNAPLLIGVGAAFDFLSGNKRQAPIWMQRSGLEWLFRLMHEPRRLWRRYVIYNPRFITGVLRQHVREHLTRQTGMC